ncbi:MAG TPA: hypothetical protein VEC36_00970, partial [Patescibacteria group bacterium]|nr:hypothetical protein [Patescibacteria group bacterium]
TFTQPVAQRGGIALQGSFHLPASNGYRFAIIPTVAYLSAGNEFPAQGASVAFATWFPKLGVITPYTAVGPAIGFRNSNEWGYGAIVNLGAAMEIFTNITLNAEVAGIVQVNQYDNITHGVVSPSVSLGWTF